VSGAYARAPWIIATILWRSIISAIIPMSLKEIIRKLPQIAERLAEMTGHQKHQVDKYRAKYKTNTPGLPVESC
jgi:hypothetical protein